MDLAPIAEETEEPISEEHEDEIMAAVGTADLFTNSDTSPQSNPIPLVSQTQPEVEDVDSDDEDSDPLSGRSSDKEATSIAADVNGIFDPDDDFAEEELDFILDHRFLSGILELQVQYSTGEIEWHPLDLVKHADAQAVAHYVLTNDLGPISNGKHCR